jgi:hypothetical protein
MNASNAAPPAKPSQACRRFTYETGQNHPTQPAGTVGSSVAITSAFEQIARVSQSACWLLQLDVIIYANEATPTTVWVLAWDVVASEAASDALINQELGAARYSYGPITPGDTGAMLIREPQEWFQIPNGNNGHDEFCGQPFDSGCLVAVSSTPRVYTQIDANIMSVVARGRR